MKDSTQKPIYDLTPFTLLDFPDNTACIVWFAGCNMQCVYCYNPDIVNGKGRRSCADVLTFLKTRIGLLGGVVLSGGECTVFKYLEDFASEIKAMGFKIKVDTNGGNPKVLEKLIDAKLVDYIALDFKASAPKFYNITGSKLFDNFEKSLDLLLDKRVSFEIRTTFHDGLLNEKDLSEMLYFLRNKNFQDKLYVQIFRNNTETIGQINNADQYKVSKIMNKFKEDIIVRC